jgi:choline kinase
MAEHSRPATAVILAAGRGTRLGDAAEARPKGFIELGDMPIVDRSLNALAAADIRQVVIVTGHQSEWYERLADRRSGLVRTVNNSDYAVSGSLRSLGCALESIDESILVLESDLIYEGRAVSETLDHERDCVLLTSGFTDSGDEVYVGTTEDGLLLDLGKDRSALRGVLAGELVGITKLSRAAVREMRGIAQREESFQLEYENGLVAIAPAHPIACHVVDDLAWAEIDDISHLERARSIIYPAIVQREGG